MALHSFCKPQQLRQHTLGACRSIVVPRPLQCQFRGRAENSSRAAAQSIDSSAPETCAMQILAFLQDRQLEGLLPYLSEISVVKAVVRQHHARLEEQKQLDKLREQQRQQRAQQSSTSHLGRSYSSGLATYESSSTSYDAISPYEAQHTVQHWSQPPQVYPPRPPCPVPGVDTSRDYLDDYQSFNMQDYETPSPGDVDMDMYRSQPPPANGQRAVRVPDFLSVLDAAQAGDESQHLLDSYAMRHLVLSRPAQLEPLSGMRLSQEQFVLRVRSTSLWGEKCVLTFTLKKRSAQELKSTYSKHPRKEPWVLSKVVGEPLSWDPLEAISPEHPPEAIVAAQVEALRECDFNVAYSLTSPVGRAVAGTRDRFRAALQGDFRYQPVLMHARATSIHRTHSNANTYLEVFDVQGQPGAGSSLFIWVATRQLEGLYKNCWMVEYVTPIRDPSVINILKNGGM